MRGLCRAGLCLESAVASEREYRTQVRYLRFILIYSGLTNTVELWRSSRAHELSASHLQLGLLHREESRAQAIFHLLEKTAGDACRFLRVLCFKGSQGLFLVRETVFNRLK